MTRIPKHILDQHHAFIETDNPFQAEARLLQSLWRESQKLEMGEQPARRNHPAYRLGSRLVMPEAEMRLTNYLTDNIRAVVRREVLDPARAKDRLYGRPRIFNDLLSSQPLCFNVFAELSLDLPLASRAFARMTGGRVSEVTSIGFEYSPGRGDAEYTDDRSAFDVFVQFHTTAGKKGFAGIEVKYHEALGDPVAAHRARYDEVAASMECFDAAATSTRLRQKPLQQIWRDHLLAGSMLTHPRGAFGDGLFAFLYPERNAACEAALRSYRACLTSTSTFETWTLEALMSAIRASGSGAWADAVVDRYLSFEKLDAFR